MKTLLSVIMLLAMAVPAAACACTGDETPCKCTDGCDCEKTEGTQKTDPAFGVKYTEERILKLPQDGGKPFLTVIGTKGDPKFEQLKTWFKTDRRLMGLANQTHFNVYPSNNEIAQDRFPNVKTFPFIRLQNSKAQRLFEVAGDNIPMSPDALANLIEADVKVSVKELAQGPLFRRNRDNCPDGNCPLRDRRDERRKDGNDEPPDEDPEPQPLDDVLPPIVNPIANNFFPWHLWGLVVVGGLVVGAWPEIRNRAKAALAAPAN